METIKLDSGDTRGEIGYSVGDNSLFIDTLLTIVITPNYQYGFLNKMR